MSLKEDNSQYSEMYNLIGKEFINLYMQRPFGSMNKNDIEVLIFHLYSKYGELNGMDTYEMSRFLMIPESKVKRLVYEAALRYSHSDEGQIKAKFFEYLKVAQFKGEADNRRITFVVSDKLVRSAINSTLYKAGHYSDTSFNRDILTIHMDALIYLIEHFYGKDVVQEIEKELNEAIKDAANNKITFNAVMKEFLLGMAKGTGSATATAGFAAISGGLSSIGNLIDPLMKFLRGS